MTPTCHGTFAPQYLPQGPLRAVVGLRIDGRDLAAAMLCERGERHRGEFRQRLSNGRPVTFAAKPLLCTRVLGLRS
jgi:hypothetical protein